MRGSVIQTRAAWRHCVASGATASMVRHSPPVKLACHVAAAGRQLSMAPAGFQPACTSPRVARPAPAKRSTKSASSTATTSTRRPPLFDLLGQLVGQLEDAIHAGSLSLISLRACKPIGAQGPHLPLSGRGDICAPCVCSLQAYVEHGRKGCAAPGQRDGGGCFH
nr:MAG TPA: hypothetical protein [Caudoviricetes sp.]